MGELVAIAVVAAVYFVPAYLGRHKRNARSIAVVNLFLGWTFVGWVVALAWALMDDKSG